MSKTGNIASVVGAAVLSTSVLGLAITKSGTTEGVTMDEITKQRLAVNLPPADKPADASPLYPDLVILKFGECAKSEKPCFRIVERADGKRMLKWPAATLNIGKGPAEIRANRTTPKSDEWVPHQILHYDNGDTQTLPASGLEFYFATDLHQHWHVRDFDSYELIDPSGDRKTIIGEKHGFCLEDNTQYRGVGRDDQLAWADDPKRPESPVKPVYRHSESCGHTNTDATSITHGLSVGWGDTYPTTLIDQGIDITNLPDGRYVVRVVADANDDVKETNEQNNTAESTVEITGDEVKFISDDNGH